MSPEEYQAASQGKELGEKVNDLKLKEEKTERTDGSKKKRKKKNKAETDYFYLFIYQK